MIKCKEDKIFLLLYLYFKAYLSNLAEKQDFLFITGLFSKYADTGAADDMFDSGEVI